MVKKEITLSIIMLAYNHEKYIEEALESILIQNVDFNYEIIIGEDCSTDSTPIILKKYEKKYPNILTVLYRKKNLGATKNLYDLLHYINGKYVIFLEGDDFWIDKNKIEKQVQFLEKNPHYIAVSHTCVFVDENSKRIEEIKLNGNYWSKSVYTTSQFENNFFPGHTTTIMMRNIFEMKSQDFSIYYRAHYLVGDRTTIFLLVEKGDIFCMKDLMSAYRYICKKNGTNARSIATQKNNSLEMWKYYQELEKYSKKNFKKNISFSNLKSSIFFNAIVILFKNFNIVNLKIVLCIFKQSDNKKENFIFILRKLHKKFLKGTK